MAEARNLKFGMHWPRGVLTKIKNSVKGAVKGSSDLLLEFWDPLHISLTDEATNIKLGTQVATTGNNAKLG